MVSKCACVTGGQRQGLASNLLLLLLTVEAFLKIFMAKEGDCASTLPDQTLLCSELWGLGQPLLRDWSHPKLHL